MLVGNFIEIDVNGVVIKPSCEKKVAGLPLLHFSVQPLCLVSQAMLKRSRPDRTKQRAYLQGAEVWVLGFSTFVQRSKTGPDVWGDTPMTRVNERLEQPPKMELLVGRCFFPFPFGGILTFSW